MGHRHDESAEMAMLSKEEPEKTIVLDAVGFTFQHALIAIGICIATMADGFNDNFPAFSHDNSANFTCNNTELNSWEHWQAFGADEITTRIVNDTMFQKCPMPTSPNSTDEVAIPNCEPVFFDKSSMQPNQKSFITEYGYVCQKLKIAASLVSLMFTGVMSAAPFNYFTDIIGRKKMMLIACFMQTMALIFIWCSNNVWLYGTGMFFQGFFGGLKYKAADVLIIESVTQEYRSLAGTLLLIGFSLGYAFCPVLAYIFPDWRDMIKCMILIGFGACLVIWLLVLESTSWLFQTGTPDKLEEGVANLKKLIPDERTRRLVETGLRNKNKARQIDNTDKSSFLDNMRYFATNKILIPRLCVNAIYWFCTSILFRSFAIGTSLLPGSPYTNAAISAGFDILACFLSYFVLKLVGRRSSLAASYLLVTLCTGTCGLLTMMDADKYESIIRWVAFTSKLGMLGAHNIGYIYSPELFPTMQRTTAMGVIGIIEGIGAVISPYFLLIYSFNASVFYYTEAVIGVCAAVLVIAILPETGHLGLPENDDDLREQDKTRLTSKFMRMIGK